MQKMLIIIVLLTHYHQMCHFITRLQKQQPKSSRSTSLDLKRTAATQSEQ